MLSCGCVGSISARCWPCWTSGDAIFSEPVHLHLQLADLLIEPLHQLLLFALTPPTGAVLEDASAGVLQLAFPLRDLHRMHAELARQLIERLLPFDRLERDARLELAAMSSAWPACRVLGSRSLNAHMSRFLLALYLLLL